MALHTHVFEHEKDELRLQTHGRGSRGAPTSNQEDVSGQAVLCPPSHCIPAEILQSLPKDNPEAIERTVRQLKQPHHFVWEKACEQFVSQCAFNCFLSLVLHLLICKMVWLWNRNGCV